MAKTEDWQAELWNLVRKLKEHVITVEEYTRRRDGLPSRRRRPQPSRRRSSVCSTRLWTTRHPQRPSRPVPKDHRSQRSPWSHPKAHTKAKSMAKAKSGGKGIPPHW
jgi:hypothetical protein